MGDLLRIAIFRFLIVIIIIIIISNIYPGCSTHSKVVFTEVLHPIELEFGNANPLFSFYFFFSCIPYDKYNFKY